VGVVDRAYQYLRHIAVNSSGVPIETSDNLVRSELSKLEESARDAIASLQVENFSYEDPDKKPTYTYILNIPEDGRYVLNLHYPNLEIKEFAVSGIEGLEGLSRSGDSFWFKSSLIQIRKGEYELELPNYTHNKDYEEVLAYLSIESEPGRTTCKDLDVFNKVVPDTSYEFTFETINMGGEKMFFDVWERSGAEDEYRKGRIYVNYYDLDKTGRQLVRGKYFPEKYAKEAKLSFCLDDLSLVNSNTEISKFKIKTNYPIPVVFASTKRDASESIYPKVEFVSMNQTKYLVKVASESDKYVLNFNQRYDPNWRVRDVSCSAASEYLAGNTREYFSGKVVEYPMNDKHYLTDLIFIEKKYPDTSKIVLNGFSNAWLMNDIGDEKCYLIEYNVQNTFYKSILISFLSLVVSALVVLIYAHRNN
jgi:hypothetical protein